MSNAGQNQEGAPVSRQGGKGLITIMAVALAAAVGVSAYALARLHHERGGLAMAPEGDAAAADQPVLYLPLDPPFVVNFHNQQALNYLQVGVTLMAHDPAAIKAARDADPVIRNALVMLFSSQDYAALSSTEGKQKLRDEALQAVRKAVQGSLGKPGIDALYFTSFVMQ
jgi:flagellar FliL protein